MAFAAPTLPSDVVHPISMRGISCTCGAELEVDDVDHPTELLCPAGCVVALAENLRALTECPTPICPRCTQPILRDAGQIGRTPKIHAACRTPAEIAAMAAQRALNAEYYRANAEKWRTTYYTRKPGALGRPRKEVSHGV
jgi:hypothetical protein